MRFLAIALVAGTLCSCKVYYDRPRIRQLEADNQRLQERLKECEDPKPRPAANWFDWWFDG